MVGTFWQVLTTYPALLEVRSKPTWRIRGTGVQAEEGMETYGEDELPVDIIKFGEEDGAPSEHDAR